MTTFIFKIIIFFGRIHSQFEHYESQSVFNLHLKYIRKSYEVNFLNLILSLPVCMRLNWAFLDCLFLEFYKNTLI